MPPRTLPFAVELLPALLILPTVGIGLEERDAVAIKREGTAKQRHPAVTSWKRPRAERVGVQAGAAGVGSGSHISAFFFSSVLRCLRNLLRHCSYVHDSKWSTHAQVTGTTW